MRRESTCNRAANLLVASNDRIELAFARRFRQIARIFLQRVILILGRGAVGRAALAQSLDRGVESLRGDAGLREDAGGVGSLLEGERQEQPLDRDIGVAGLLRYLLGVVEEPRGRGRHVELARSRALHLGELGERGFRLGQRLARAPASAVDKAGGEPLAVVEQNLQHMLGRELLMAFARGERLRRLHEAANPIGIFVDIHMFPWKRAEPQARYGSGFVISKGAGRSVAPGKPQRASNARPGIGGMTEAGRIAAGSGRGKVAPLGPVLVVTGLAREAAALGADVVPLVSGADAGALRRALAERAKTPFSAVVSFGLAGGLDPSLSPGTMIVASGVVAGTERFECPPALVQVLVEGFAGAGVTTRHGLVAGVEAPVMMAAAKTQLFRETAALAVDMELHLAAAFARQRGLPFAVARVISDPARRALPPLAAKAVRPDGSVDVGLVLGEIAREPRQLAGLIAAGLELGGGFRNAAPLRTAARPSAAPRALVVV